MQDALSSFIIGFLYTATLFILCLITVVGIKSLFLYLKKSLIEKLTPKAPPTPIKKSIRKRKPKTVDSTSTVTSIEIDPDKIDRIYVKKIS